MSQQKILGNLQEQQVLAVQGIRTGNRDVIPANIPMGRTRRLMCRVWTKYALEHAQWPWESAWNNCGHTNCFPKLKWGRHNLRKEYLTFEKSEILQQSKALLVPVKAHSFLQQSSTNLKCALSRNMWSTWICLSVIWNFQPHFPLKCLLYLLLCIKQAKLIYIAGSDFPHLFWLSQQPALVLTISNLEEADELSHMWLLTSISINHKQQQQLFSSSRTSTVPTPSKCTRKKNNKRNKTFEVPHIAYIPPELTLTVAPAPWEILNIQLVIRPEQAGLCGYKIILEYHPHSPILLPCLDTGNLFSLPSST